MGGVGNEGFRSPDALLGSSQGSQTTICQVPGNCLRMTIQDFREAVTGDTPLRRLAQHYTVTYLGQVSKSTACNRLHVIEVRIERWILMTHDRVGDDAFPLTHEFLSEMLGAQRSSVSLVAQALQRAGLIDYKRGQMVVLSRQGLEDISCECYTVVLAEHDRLLGSDGQK